MHLLSQVKKCKNDLAYNIIYIESVEKDLRKIDSVQVQNILNKIETFLTVDPKSQPQLAGKSFKNFRKLRVGDYRVIYTISENNVIIGKIGNRKDIYEK